jgi:hypothetical protein
LLQHTLACKAKGPLNDQRLAAAFALRLLPLTVPGFRGRIEAVRDGVAITLGKHVGFIQGVSGGWTSGPGLVQRTPMAVGASGALAVLVASLLSIDSRPQRTLVASTDTLLTPLASASASEWLGFLRLRHGWLGVAAVSSASQEYLRFAIDSDRLLSRPAAEAARYLQERGIAAMPAVQAPPNSVFNDSHRPANGDRPRRLLLDVDGRSLKMALQSYRILDLGRVIAAPFAADILRLLGAQVRAIRPPGYGAHWGGGDEIDLNSGAGQELLRVALAEVDLVIENFRPRGWAQVVQPASAALVQRRVALRGFPNHSPFANWKLFGFLVEGAFGVGPVPTTSSEHSIRASRIPVWDRVAGVVGAASAISLLRGNHASVEISQVVLARTLSALRKQAAAHPA